MDRQRQGDMGEASARCWYELNGYDVYVPTGHTRDADFLAADDDSILRVQVKTSGCVSPYGRWAVTICTRGGNQSWSGLSKAFSAERCDELFIVVVDGRRWRIPSRVVQGGRGINVGGAKYAEYEVEAGPPLGTPAGLRSLPSSAAAG